ncbi:MAG: hypothetical protein ABSG67_22365 [Thermoguttaceae bacterium]|jgi:hypothetical protein
MTTAEHENPPLKRRWHQYSLRTLFILTFLVACASSWLGVKMRQARRQNEAVDALIKLGGKVGFDYKDRGATPSDPAWLRNLFGDGNVTSIDLSRSKVTNVDLERLKGM